MMGSCGLDSSGLGKGPVEGSCEHCNERTFGFHKRRVIPWQAELLLASQEGLRSMEHIWLWGFA